MPLTTDILQPTGENIERAAAEIKAGGVVAFPTETVYGLGGNALNDSSIKKIFEVKGRPSDNPLIAHLSSPNQINDIAFLDSRAQKLIEAFMPGAITLVFKKRERVPLALTGGLSTVAVRVPDNPVAQELIKKCGFPIAAPSANTSGKPSPTTARHVFDDLSGKIKYILDGGSCRIGLESAIVDFSGEKIRLLRKGGISLEDIRAHVGGEIELLESFDRPLCPGMKYRHYAPKARVVLFENGDVEGIREMLKGRQNALVLSLNYHEGIRFESVKEYASRLFFEFRRADSLGYDIIICEKAPESGLGAPINNRLEKASHYE